MAAFLTWLFVGAGLAGVARKRFGDAAVPLGMAVTAIAALAMIPAWDELPRLFAGLGKAVTSFSGREAVRGAVAFGILALPTTAMGLTFPLLLRRVGTYPNVAAWVGRLTAINTVGAVLGALVTGYALLPLLGSQGSLTAIAVAFALMALAALPWTRGGLEASDARRRRDRGRNGDRDAALGSERAHHRLERVFRGAQSPRRGRQYS